MLVQPKSLDDLIWFSLHTNNTELSKTIPKDSRNWESPVFLSPITLRIEQMTQQFILPTEAMQINPQNFFLNHYIL